LFIRFSVFSFNFYISPFSKKAVVFYFLKNNDHCIDVYFLFLSVDFYFHLLLCYVLYFFDFALFFHDYFSKKMKSNVFFRKNIVEKSKPIRIFQKNTFIK